MGELSKTLKNYKNTYISRLAKYLDDHEDNTESLFLQKELDASNEILETLNTYKTNSKSFGFQTLKDHFDISILENSGFDLDKVDNHIASIYSILVFIKQKQESMVPGEEIVAVKTETNSNPEKSEAVENSDLNDYTKSTIEDYLTVIEDDINSDDYKLLTDALYSYFTTDRFPQLERKIMFKRVNKKKVGWALKEVYKNLKREALDIEYFRFAKENINLFEKEVIQRKDFNKSKFYKIFTTNPSK